MSKKEEKKSVSKKKSSNKGKILTIVMTVIALLLLVAYVVLEPGASTSNTVLDSASQFSPQTRTPQCKQVPYSDEECKKVPYTDQEAYYEQECQQVPYTDQECESKKLSYRANEDDLSCETNCIDDHEECQDYFLGVCTSWETICDVWNNRCTFSITNLDNQKGQWTYKWSSSCKSPNCISTGESNTDKIYGMNLDPTESDSTWARVSYKSSYQKNYLSAKIISEPTKQVCRDVIKHRKECEQVTRYRPVTKYRTDCTTVTKYREECS